MATKDEMIIYIDANPNERIAGLEGTIFWRHDLTYYSIHPITNEMKKLDVGFIKDKKYDHPLYKSYQFVYKSIDETWLKVGTDAASKTGWQFIQYSPPTLAAAGGAPIPPTPTPTVTVTPTVPDYCCSGSTFCGMLTGSFVIGNVINSQMTGTFYIITGSVVTGSGSGWDKHIDLPSDGYYGDGPDGNAAGLEQGDLLEDALDKLDSVLDKLIPPKPPGLSSKSLILVSSYSAKMAGTNLVFGNLSSTTTPQFQLAGGMTAANSFYDADRGVLTGLINGYAVGTASLTTGSDVGVYNGLQITFDGDYYAGQVGKAGFWNTLLAQINTPASVLGSVGPHVARMNHSRTGNTPNLNFYLDDPVTPSALTLSITGSGVSYISGVPALVGGANGASILATGSANGTTGRFYNSNQLFSLAGSGISTAAFPIVVLPTSGSNQKATNTFAINAGSRTENASFTLTAYNSVGATTTLNLTGTNVRMDYPLESRVQSNVGQFPTSYGQAYDSTQVLTVNEELQFLNGQFQYPTGNYTSAKPVAGPNYTSVAGGSWNSMRWATFNLGSGTSFKNVQLTFTNDGGTFNEGDPQLPSIPNFALYVRVDGAIPTNGWVDGNAAYPGVGDPTNNGDAALSFSSSTKTMKLVTFGTQIKTGNVIVRVGIPQGNGKKFGGITMTLS